MPQLPETPWELASQALGGTGNQLTRLAVGMQAMRNRQQIAQEQLAIRDALVKGQLENYKSEGDLRSSERDINLAKLSQANAFGPAFGGTNQALVAAATLAGLAGHPEQMYAEHNIPPGDVAQQITTGNMVGDNPKPDPLAKLIKLSAGETLFDPSTMAPVYSTDPKPAKNAGMTITDQIKEFTNLKNAGLLPQNVGVPGYMMQALTNAPVVPQKAAVPAPSAAPDLGKHKTDALDAIRRGANPAAVRQMFQQQTGQPADF